jgi:hypothetical protein
VGRSVTCFVATPHQPERKKGGSDHGTAHDQADDHRPTAAGGFTLGLATRGVLGELTFPGSFRHPAE